MSWLHQIIAAFLSGLLSFFAACVIPLFPTYISVITGFTFAELYGLDFDRIRGRVFRASLFFVLGFSFVFTLLGATGSIVGQLLEAYLPSILRLTGGFLLVLGLIQTGVIKMPGLTFDYAWNIQQRLTKLGNLTALTTGVAAALAWIPCVGPLLSPILLLAANSKTVIFGALLLLIYSVGLTSPFLLAALFFPTIASRLRQHAQMFHRLSIGAGVILIAFGIILILDQYQVYIDLFSL